MDMCDFDIFIDSQYGFIPERGTNMATSLVHDVSSYCVTKGSPIFMCSLDAEGAYDSIPHAVILYKTRDVIPTTVGTSSSSGIAI